MVLLSGATRVLDRVVGCVLGLLLIAAGLAALGWRQHLALTWPERVDLSPALTAMAIDWVPVVLLLVGSLLIAARGPLAGRPRPGRPGPNPAARWVRRQRCAAGRPALGRRRRSG